MTVETPSPDPQPFVLLPLEQADQHRRDNIAALIIIGAAVLLPASLGVFFFILFTGS